MPFELLKNVDYLRWRLQRPSEKEIYLFHLTFHLKQLGLQEQIFSLPENQWLEQILTQRGRTDDLASLESTFVWSALDERSRLYIEIARCRKEISRLIKQSQVQEQRCCAAENDNRRLEQCYHEAENERERLSQELTKADEYICAIRGSKAYRVVQKYYRIRDRIFPIGSRRRKLGGYIVKRLKGTCSRHIR